MALHYNLLIQLISENEVDKEDLKSMFSCSVKGYSIDQAKTCMDMLDQSKYLSLFDGKRPTFQINETNDKMLNALEQKGWISSYSIENDDYRAFGKKTN